MPREFFFVKKEDFKRRLKDDNVALVVHTPPYSCTNVYDEETTVYCLVNIGTVPNKKCDLRPAEHGPPTLVRKPTRAALMHGKLHYAGKARPVCRENGSVRFPRSRTDPALFRLNRFTDPPPPPCIYNN